MNRTRSSIATFAYSLCALSALLLGPTGCGGGGGGGGGGTTPPTSGADFVSTQEDTAITIEPLANDSGEGLSISSIGVPTLGTLVDLGGGRFEFTPNPDANGTETLTYEVSNSGGSDNGAIEIEIAAVPDAPRPTDDSIMVDEDSAATFDPLANDVEVDGDPLAVTAVTQGASGTVSFTATEITYTPNADFCGTDTFTYEVSDAPTSGAAQAVIATVTVEVQCLNDDPVATDDSNVTLRTGFAFFNVLENDTDIDGDALVISQITTAPTLGSATIVGTEIRYDSGDVAGVDTLTYEVSDGNGGTSTAEVMVTVTDFSLEIAGGPLTATYDPRDGLGVDRIPVRATWDSSVATATGLTSYDIEIAIDPTRFVVQGAVPSADFDSTQGGIDPEAFTVDLGPDSVTVTATLPAGESVLLDGDLALFELEIDFTAATRGNPAGVSDPLQFVAAQSRIGTLEGPLSPTEGTIELDLQAIDLDDGFYYFGGAPRIPFDSATGVGSFELDLSVVEYGPAMSPTQGFSMGVAFDSDAIALSDIQSTGPLSELFGGSGPDFFGELNFGQSMTVGVVYSFTGGTFLTFNPGAPVIRISGDTVPAVLSGTVDPVTVTARWDSTLGAPPVENVVVVGGQSVQPVLIDGVLELVPQP